MMIGNAPSIYPWGESLNSAHCALLLDYVSPEEPQANPLQPPVELGDPNCPSSRKLQTTFAHITHIMHIWKHHESVLVATLNPIGAVFNHFLDCFRLSFDVVVRF